MQFLLSYDCCSEWIDKENVQKALDTLFVCLNKQNVFTKSAKSESALQCNYCYIFIMHARNSMHEN